MGPLFGLTIAAQALTGIVGAASANATARKAKADKLKAERKEIDRLIKRYNLKQSTGEK